MRHFMKGRAPTRSAFSMVALGCVALVACNSSSDSRDVDTSDIYAQYIARAEGDGRTVVLATLRTGRPTSLNFVGLYGGDRLIATEVDPVTMARLDLPMVGFERSGKISYIQVFVHEDKNLGVEIEFDRDTTGGTSAPSSSVTLPSRFALDWVEDPVTMAAAPIAFSRSSATPYYVVWDPFDAPDFEPGDELSYEVTGSCIQRFTGPLDWEAGVDLLQLTGVLVDRPAPNDGLGCTILVTITLSRTGSVDPLFAGGSFVGEQVRSLVLFANP